MNPRMLGNATCAIKGLERERCSRTTLLTFAIVEDKFRLPTTKNPAKQLSKLCRIRQKLTCVQMWDHDKSHGGGIKGLWKQWEAYELLAEKVQEVVSTVSSQSATASSASGAAGGAGGACVSVAAVALLTSSSAACAAGGVCVLVAKRARCCARRWRPRRSASSCAPASPPAAQKAQVRADHRRWGKLLRDHEQVRDRGVRQPRHDQRCRHHRQQDGQ